MQSVGSINISLTKESDKAILLLSDTGKGISPSNQKLIFNPGFTTKKRGWGLGLSLAKRIIENYHSGKIFVKSSKVNEGTTFAIHLPTS
jgi:signal transduction histidine kinase